MLVESACVAWVACMIACQVPFALRFKKICRNMQVVSPSNRQIEQPMGDTQNIKIFSNYKSNSTLVNDLLYSIKENLSAVDCQILN